MRHQQILTKLGAGMQVRALDEDLAVCVGWQMLGGRLTHREVERAVLPLVLARWGCLLDAGDAGPATTDKVWVALATLLHRYGLSYPDVTAKALAAIDDLLQDGTDGVLCGPVRPAAVRRPAGRPPRRPAPALGRVRDARADLSARSGPPVRGAGRRAPRSAGPGRSPAGPRPDEVPNPMSEGSYMLTDMFRLQHDLAKLYGDATVEDGR